MKGKKLLSVIMSIMLVSLSGCGNKAENVENDNIVSSDNTTSVSSQQVDEEKDTTTSQTGNNNIDNNTSKTDENTTSEPITSTVIQTMVQNIVSSVKQPSSPSLDEPTTSQEPVASEPTVSENPVIIEPTTSEPAKPIDEPSIIFATQILLSKTSVSLMVGDITTITATLLPTNVTDKVIKWTSSNTSVATVSNGKITAKAIGTTIITATTSNGKTATCTVTVKKAEPIVPTSVKLSQNTLSLSVGSTKTLSATISPSNAENKALSWTSSNTSVATVSNGKITAKAIGTTTITATTSNGKTATCKVTVKEVDPYAKPFNAELIKADMIRYIKSLGVNYVEMELEDGSWTVPISTFNNYYHISTDEWTETNSNRFKNKLYDAIDYDLEFLTQDCADYNMTAEEMCKYLSMCPYIYEDPDHKGDLLITVIYK